MSDVQDFLSEMESHQYDRNDDGKPGRPEDLDDGEYTGQITDCRPRRVESLNCWSFDCTVNINGKSIQFGSLLGTPASKNRLGRELETLGFAGKDFTELLNNAIAALPNRWAKIKKASNQAKNGKTYHNIYLMELVNAPKPGKSTADKSPDDSLPF